MRRGILVLMALAALTNPFVARPGLTDDAPVTQVNIVEPNFQPPQAWTYDPTEMTAPMGTTITWTNTGAVAHTVTADDGTSFDSASLDPGAAFSITPASAGTYTYHCSFHPWMIGTITVTE